MSSRHDGVTCDACQRREFRLRRYKCLICHDYDLCGSCFDTRRATNKHSISHPMQCLIPKADHNLFYHGEPTSEYSVHSFTCPLCGQLGFTETSFSHHVFQSHPGQETGDAEVICPLCATHAEGDQNRQTRHMARHLMAVHHLSAAPTEPTKDSQSTESSYVHNFTSNVANSTDSTRHTSNHRLPPFVLLRSHRTNRAQRSLHLTANRNTSSHDVLVDLITSGSRNADASARLNGEDWASNDSRPPTLAERSSFRSQNNAAVERPYTMPSSTSAPPPSTTQAITTSVYRRTDALDGNFATTGRDSDEQQSDEEHQMGLDGLSSLGAPILLECISSETSEAAATTVLVPESGNDVQSTTQVSAAASSLHKSLSGDPSQHHQQLDEATSSTVKDPELKLPDSSVVPHHVEPTRKRATRDEFDANWAAFLSNLVWSSLCFPNTEESRPPLD
ncbi:unnamed protein product [Dicrocoelium dendriticum]|nr:unnamed protein product [Dicrocoelium dendriticum]